MAVLLVALIAGIPVVNADTQLNQKAIKSKLAVILASTNKFIDSNPISLENYKDDFDSHNDYLTVQSNGDVLNKMSEDPFFHDRYYIINGNVIKSSWGLYSGAGTPSLSKLSGKDFVSYVSFSKDYQNKFKNEFTNFSAKATRNQIKTFLKSVVDKATKNTPANAQGVAMVRGDGFTSYDFDYNIGAERYLFAIKVNTVNNVISEIQIIKFNGTETQGKYEVHLKLKTSDINLQETPNMDETVTINSLLTHPEFASALQEIALEVKAAQVYDDLFKSQKKKNKKTYTSKDLAVAAKKFGAKSFGLKLEISEKGRFDGKQQVMCIAVLPEGSIPSAYKIDSSGTLTNVATEKLSRPCDISKVDPVTYSSIETDKNDKFIPEYKKYCGEFSGSKFPTVEQAKTLSSDCQKVYLKNLGWVAGQLAIFSGSGSFGTESNSITVTGADIQKMVPSYLLKIAPAINNIAKITNVKDGIKITLVNLPNSSTEITTTGSKILVDGVEFIIE